jgi:hypothetical protein
MRGWLSFDSVDGVSQKVFSAGSAPNNFATCCCSSAAVQATVTYLEKFRSCEPALLRDAPDYGSYSYQAVKKHPGPRARPLGRTTSRALVALRLSVGDAGPTLGRACGDEATR